ncbi:MAG: hypothetical protein JWM28_1488 [Chitinophagaceae bacterium]|nr:hypothetical protein [Chitinophagaceae bacterium]
MKQLKIKLLLFSATVLGMTSCLKEGSPNVDTGNASNIIQFSNTGNNSAAASSKYPNFYTDLGSLAEGATAEFNLNISYAGSANAPEDITVNLVVDNDLLTLFNDQNGTTYVIPPTSVFAFPSSVVIKKGTRTAQVKATVTRSADYDFGEAYAIPLSITSASKGTISDNFGKSVYSFGVRNQFDGDYAMDITSSGWAAYGISDGPTLTWPSNIGLSTTGANTLIIVDYARGGDALQPAFTADESVTAFGATTPLFTIDPTTYALSVINSTADDGRGRILKLNPAATPAENSYDPATKTIHASYIMGQNGRPDQYFTLVLTYVGPRP